MFKRTEESGLTSWFFEIDRRLLYMVLLLMVIGMFFAVSAGSVVAENMREPWYFFFVKGLPFYAIGVCTLFVASLLNKKIILKLSILDVVIGFMLLAVTIIAPHIIKGSARFVAIGPFNVLPADIMKPGFIILTAWFLAEMHERFGEKLFIARDAWKFRVPSWWMYIALFVPALVVIFTHPDVGSTLLYLGVLICMLLIAGLSWWAFGGMIAAGAGILTIAYYTMEHVHKRIDTLITGTGDKFQITQSVQSIQHGGFFGSGDNAFIKEKLPDAHTDFIYAAIVEDLGAILAFVMLCLLVYVLKLLVTDAMNARDKFVFYAVGGTAALFGIQCCINLVSTLGLFAPKGMTLPFISYGGSSLVGFCLLFGMVLAIVREDKWRG
ncbi:MAG: FtsW/RodA/SpoVE family cell cycle protein [Alphaproteobacteria bacterium]|jgi:cell division protein FtsW|nr:FtsW/RodA/SpoVE family cell cycle protein [Alphaproteobacteria bacterium]